MGEQKDATGTTEPAIGVSDIRKRIDEYRAQLENTNQQLQILEQSYHTKREQGVQSLHQLAGAIGALEALLPQTGPQTTE